MSAIAVGGARPRRRWIWVIVALAVTAALVAPVSLRLWLKASRQYQASPVAVYRSAISRLQIDAPDGQVTISPGRQLQVQSSATWVFGKPSVRRIVTGRTLQVSAACPQPNVFEDCQVSLAIRVPAGLAISVQAGSGAIDVRGLAGSLDLAVTSGTISMSGVSGTVRASATSGPISGSGLKAVRLSAAVTSGRLQLSFDDAPQFLILAVGSGSGQAVVPAGSRYAVTASTGPPSLQLGAGLADASARSDLTATVGSGVLTVGYPSPAGA
jgi:Putative adhesin